MPRSARHRIGFVTTLLAGVAVGFGSMPASALPGASPGGGPDAAQGAADAAQAAGGGLDGELVVTVLDGLTGYEKGGGQHTETAAHLLIDGQRVPVPADLVRGQGSGPVRISVAGASVSGRSAGEIAALVRSGASTITAVAPAGRGNRAVLGRHEVTIVPVYWTENPDAIWDERIRDSMGFAANYWAGNTDDQIDFDLQEITEATKISLSRASIDNCDYDAVEREVRRAHPDLPVDQSHHLVVVTPPWSACWWGGLALVDGGLSWINGDMPGSVYAHEFGHNLGLMHGASLTCYADSTRRRTVTYSNYCETMTYDDSWDIMGARATGALAAGNRWRIGTIPPAARVNVTRGDRITLAPVSATSGIRSIAFRHDGYEFEVEYRTPTGWDDWIDSTSFTHSSGVRMTTPGGGVIVRRSEGDFAEINFHPDGTYHENRHSGLDAGESYIFPGSDFAITVEAADASGATVRFGSAQGVQRWSGADRYETSVVISENAFGSDFTRAYVASGEIFTDALSGAGVAGMTDNPLFLTRSDYLPNVLSSYLMQFSPIPSLVFGGPATVSGDALEMLQSLGSSARVSGADRYETSAAISRENFAPGVKVAYVASGLVFPDALSGAPVAGKEAAPMLLTRPDVLPGSIASELARVKPARVVVLGGPATVSENVLSQVRSLTGVEVTRVSGADRYEVSAQISAVNFAPGADIVFVASGEIFTDALSGAPAAGAAGAPLLLVKGHSVPPAVTAELKRLRPKQIVILGGPNSVSPGVERSLANLTSS
jgi:putative cell wall-binding protein